MEFTNFKDTTVHLMIASSFCSFKTVQIAYMEYREVLNEFDPFDTKKSFKMYGNKCTDKNKNYFLHWSQIMSLSHYNNTEIVSKVLLPGLYEQVTICISHTSTMSSQPKFSHLDITWQDTNILQRVDTSLQLNRKQYLIFTESSKSDRLFTWMEAEEICMHHGGHLPSISSQSDVQDVIDIVLRAAWAGPIRMIYIGLKVSTKTFFKEE